MCHNTFALHWHGAGRWYYVSIIPFKGILELKSWSDIPWRTHWNFSSLLFCFSYVFHPGFALFSISVLYFLSFKYHAKCSRQSLTRRTKNWNPPLTTWKEKKVFKEWTNGLISNISKEGNLQECTNWNGDTLLPPASKVLSRILINRIQTVRQGKIFINRILNLRKRFRGGRGTAVRSLSSRISWSKPTSRMPSCTSILWENIRIGTRRQPKNPLPPQRNK